MKITQLETLRLESRPSVIWVRLHTDQGLAGLGETWFGTGAVEADLHERIAPLILGEDTREIERLNRRMRPYVGFAGTGVEMRALSAVDVALWDLAGQAADRPIHALLGGPLRAEIPVYNTCAGPDYVSKTSAVRPENFGLPGAEKARQFEDLEAFLKNADELAADLLETGIGAMKIWPFDFAAGAAEGLDISAADLARALEPFEKVRAALGDKMRLKAELHGLWSLPAAKKIAAALEPLDMDWIEDPVWMDRPSETAELAAATTAPIAGGETLGGLGAFRELIAQDALSVPIVDLTWGGGLSFARKVAALAEAAGLPVAFHDCSGPVTLAASVQLALACPNVAEQEIARAFYYGWYGDYVDRPPPLERGMIRAPEGPGLGMKLLDDVSKRKDARVRVSRL
ncbi:MAG: mandelate racemase/muconate lactonizing enzyme family protein [Kiloniellales bacterium]|nr:mandelate racemase/muconate lactonizing enzyme family protein [Kiloniellales bacterium]